MTTTIKLKNGSGVPTSGDLVQGEPAFDLTNKRLYTENASGTVIEVGTNPSTIDINAGTIDGTVIGGTTAAAGSFTTGAFSGEIAANGGIALGDGYKATFGASDDLQIYHDGANSRIDDVGAGDLVIKASAGIELKSNGTNKTAAYFVGDGAAALYHNGLFKFATTATGIDVTGTVTADGLNVQNGSNAGITFDLTTSYSPVIKGSQAVSDLYLAGVGGGGVHIYY